MLVMPSAGPHPYATLTPELVLDALDQVGVHGDGRLLALNSYENRVYQVWRDDLAPVVVKFYRPGRWSDAAIDEEHAYVLELAAREIPVVPPLVLDGRSLHLHGDFRFAIYAKRGGRAPELDRPDTLKWMGRFLGRIHAAGGRFEHRPQLDVATFGDAPRRYLIDEGWVPADLAEAYATVSSQAIEHVRWAFERAGEVRIQRLHGDCHAGNVLWTDDGPHFVDFDDARNGPAVQDLWMLLSGDREAMAQQLRHVLEGYERFRAFDRAELHLIEALRTLRLLHYAAWIAQRWEDPAFPAAFPWFNEQRYWQDRILELREQVALMDEPPLHVD
jgi:Ser/Thr protein kinase RdoA (MazF antagonist)